MRIPTDRYDWAVLYLCVVAIGCSLPLGVLKLWFSQTWLLQMLFGPICIAAIVFAVVAVFRREKPFRVLTYLVVTAVICGLILSPANVRAVGEKYFEKNRSRYDLSVKIVLSLQGQSRSLPSSFKDLTYDGRVGYFRDPDSENEFLVYRKPYDGFGYIWSKSDAWPNTVPRYDSCQVRRLGSNWFYVW